MRKLNVLVLFLALYSLIFIACSGQQGTGSNPIVTNITDQYQEITDSNKFIRASISEALGSCSANSDCTETYYQNAPSDEKECECPAACIGIPANTTTSSARNEAYDKYCVNSAEFKSKDCGIPNCSSFKNKPQYLCVNNLCQIQILK